MASRSRPPIYPELTVHGAAALGSHALMRATNAEMRAIIMKSRAMMDDTRDLIVQVDALMRSSLLVASVDVKRP